MSKKNDENCKMPDMAEFKPIHKWGRQYYRGDVQGYEALAIALQNAYFRAATGKGRTRHGAHGIDFDKQEICQELRNFKTIAPAAFQARKKIKESFRLPREEQINELLDAIVYCAAAVIVLKEDEPEVENAERKRY